MANYIETKSTKPILSRVSYVGEYAYDVFGYVDGYLNNLDINHLNNEITVSNGLIAVDGKRIIINEEMKITLPYESGSFVDYNLFLKVNMAMPDNLELVLSPSYTNPNGYRNDDLFLNYEDGIKFIKLASIRNSGTGITSLTKSLPNIKDTFNNLKNDLTTAKNNITTLTTKTNNLQTDVDKLKNDTGHKNITIMHTEVALYDSNSTFTYRKTGNIVEIRGWLKRTNHQSDGLKEFLVATLPPEVRHTCTTPIGSWLLASKNSQCYMEINKGGQIYVGRHIGIEGVAPWVIGDWFIIHIVYTI